MPVHAFVDESQRNRVYMVAVAIIEPTAVATTRKQVRALLLPGQRELHFKKEKPGRRALLADRAGGDWRRRIEPVLADVIDLGS